MAEHLGQVNQGQLISEMLDEQNKGEITREFIKEILEEALGR
jgi:hypothetical protein